MFGRRWRGGCLASSFRYRAWTARLNPFGVLPLRFYNFISRAIRKLSPRLIRNPYARLNAPRPYALPPLLVVCAVLKRNIKNRIFLKFRHRINLEHKLFRQNNPLRNRRVPRGDKADNISFGKIATFRFFNDSSYTTGNILLVSTLLPKPRPCFCDKPLKPDNREIVPKKSQTLRSRMIHLLKLFKIF